MQGDGSGFNFMAHIIRVDCRLGKGKVLVITHKSVHVKGKGILPRISLIFADFLDQIRAHSRNSRLRFCVFP